MALQFFFYSIYNTTFWTFPLAVLYQFKHQVKSVAVEGTNIIAAAQNALQKSLAKIEARESAAKAAAKKEEERIMELKRIRGERWLPCMARERQAKVSRWCITEQNDACFHGLVFEFLLFIKHSEFHMGLASFRFKIIAS